MTADLRHIANHSREALPVGTIVARTEKRSDGGRRTTRYIKYRTRATGKGGNWMLVARWLWLKHRGPIPEGYRVVRVDGDEYNDDLDNLALYTAADVIAAWQMDNPKEAEAGHRRCGRARAESNRARAAAHRARAFLPTRWYAVEIDSRRVINAPHRDCFELFAAHGARVRRAANGRGWLAAALGWCELSRIEAATLAGAVDLTRSHDFLADVETFMPAARLDVIQRARALAAEYGIELFAPSAHGWAAALWSLRRRGLIVGKLTIEPTPKAIGSRGPIVRVVPQLGSTLIAQYGTPRRADDLTAQVACLQPAEDEYEAADTAPEPRTFREAARKGGA